MLIVRALGATLIIAAIWFAAFPFLLLSTGVEPFSLGLGRLRWLGVLPVVVGALLFIWVTWLFAIVGGGTPLVFDSPTRLVASGPYCWVRNPMYIADVLIITGEALLFDSSAILTYAMVLWLGLCVLVIVLEEPRLRNQFGASYEEYCARVPRWIPAVGNMAKK